MSPPEQMTNSQNEPIRVALLGYEVASLALYSALLERTGMSIVSKSLYKTPLDATSVLPSIVEKNPDIFVIGQYSKIEEAEIIAEQIKQLAPATPVLGAVVQMSDKQSPYLDDCLFMPIRPQVMQETVIRLVDKTSFQ